MLARCHLLGQWWRHSAGQVLSARMVVGAHCPPSVICDDGEGTVLARPAGVLGGRPMWKEGQPKGQPKLMGRSAGASRGSTPVKER